MAREITAPELALLRSDTQWSKLYLAIYKPNTVYTALLNGVPSENDLVYQVTFDGGSGTLGNVKAGMTLYVGTSAGACDLGMCRIRKAPIAGTFYIGLTSEIVWADNCYLTVVDDFDLWAKHSVVSAGALLMDVDVAYVDEHSDFNPVPVLGPHAVVWLDEATVDVEFSGSDSWVFDSTISGYSWSAPGSSASSGMSTATPTVTYDTPGCYRVLCTVTAANGKSTVGVRHVFVYDRDENMPSTVFQLAQCIGDHDTGGWMFDMTMEAEASLSEIHDRALVVLFAEDLYGSTKGSIGPVENRENIVCVGRIVGESIRWDRESGLVHFTVQGLHNWLNKIKTFPVDLAFAGSATAWNEMTALTVDRALFHILYWHSTATETMDFYPSNDTRYSVDGKTIASTIWGQLTDIAFSKIFAVPGVDRLGRLFVEVDPQMVPEGDRDFPEAMQITDDDWQEAIDFQRVIVQECSLISLNAEEVNAGGFAVTRYSLSPGHVPLHFGEPEMIDRVLCASQADANEQAGLVLGWRTNPYPDVPVNFAMNNRMIDVFPRQTCGFTVATGDTPRELAFDGQLIPRRVGFYFDGDSGYFHSEVNFEGETFAKLNTNGDIPDTDEISMEIPSIPSLPALPDLPILLPGLPGEPTLSGPKKVLVHDTTKGLLYSANFNTAAPTWVQVNAGLTMAQYQAINRVVVCPNGALYVGNTRDNLDAFLAYAPYVGGTFIIIEDNASMCTKFSIAVGSGTRVPAFNCNPLSSQVAYIITAGGAGFKAFVGAGVTFAAGYAFNVPEGIGNASISYGMGQWLVTDNGIARTFPPNMGAVTDTITLATGGAAIGLERHMRVLTTGKTIHYNNSDFLIGTDNCDSFVTNVAAGSGIPSNLFLVEDALVCDPTGLIIMAQGTTQGVKSTDGASSWSNISNLPSAVRHWFAYAGGAGVASRWVAVSDGGYIYYTEDAWGTAPADKRGNVLQIVPVAHFDVVKVLEM
jgi:hypothetical protein